MHSLDTSIFSGREINIKTWGERGSIQDCYQEPASSLGLDDNMVPPPYPQTHTHFDLALCFLTLGFSIYKEGSGREWSVCQYFPLRNSESASWEASSSPLTTAALANRVDWKGPFQTAWVVSSQVKDWVRRGKPLGYRLGNLQLRFCEKPAGPPACQDGIFWNTSHWHVTHPDDVWRGLLSPLEDRKRVAFSGALHKHPIIWERRTVSETIVQRFRCRDLGLPSRIRRQSPGKREGSCHFRNCHKLAWSLKPRWRPLSSRPGAKRDQDAHLPAKGRRRPG